MDSDLRIVYANPAFCRLFGYPVGRLLGQHALMLAPERHQQTALKYWADVLNGRSEPLLDIGFRANGSELEIEVPGTVLDLQGKRILVFAARDVTERQPRAGRRRRRPKPLVAIRRGEVWWCDLGPVLGSPPGGRRPVLVVSADGFNASNLRTVVAAALTTNVDRAKRPANVLIE